MAVVGVAGRYPGADDPEAFWENLLAGKDTVGDLPTEMVEHFWRSFADALRCTLHLTVTGNNTHHMVEVGFKAVARALRQAIRREGTELPTTKGVL